MTRLIMVQRVEYVMFAEKSVVSGKSSTLWRMYLLHSPINISRGRSFGRSTMIAPSSSDSGLMSATFEVAKHTNSWGNNSVSVSESRPTEAMRSTRHQLVGVSTPKPNTRYSCFDRLLFRRHRCTALHGPIAVAVRSKGDIGVDHSR
jgi:hypothetical protein